METKKRRYNRNYRKKMDRLGKIIRLSISIDESISLTTRKSGNRYYEKTMIWQMLVIQNKQEC